MIGRLCLENIVLEFLYLYYATSKSKKYCQSGHPIFELVERHIPICNHFLNISLSIKNSL